MPSVILPAQADGLILKVSLNFSKPKLDAITAAGQTIPQWSTVDFLIDTGASMTTIDAAVAAAHGLQSHGFTLMHTASSGGVPVNCKTYDVALYIPGMGSTVGYFVEAIPVVESDFSAHSFKGLLGRDVLANCVLTYIGQSNAFILSY